MRAHERFNESGFSRFLNSPEGRLFRVVAGSAFLLAGILNVRRRPGFGAALLAWSAFPLSAGALDVCYVSAALGGPFAGAKIRAVQGLPAHPSAGH